MFSGGSNPVERALSATLVLYSDDNDRRFLGTGFAYGVDGLGLRNAHVVGNADTVRLGYRNGQEASAQVLARGAHILRTNDRAVTAVLAIRAHYAAILLLVERDGRNLHITLDPQSTGDGLRRLRVGNALDLSVHRF